MASKPRRRGRQVTPLPLAPRRNPDGFDALDPVMQAWTHMKGTLALVTALYDADSLDDAAASTMERHIATDAEQMQAALDKAWETLVVRSTP